MPRRSFSYTRTRSGVVVAHSCASERLGETARFGSRYREGCTQVGWQLLAVKPLRSLLRRVLRILGWYHRPRAGLGREHQGVQT